MQELKKWLPDIDFSYWIQRGAMELMNRQRENIESIGYVLFTLPAEMPALPEPRNFIRRRIMGDPPLSLVELEQAFWMIGEDSRTKGVILHLRGARLSMADLQTLRSSILRLKDQGKLVICFAQSYDTALYYVASAADQILLQTGGDLVTIGLHRSATFLKDALSSIGVEIEAVAISPYKSAADQFTRMDFSEESRAQMDWLLDSAYEQLLEGIADGRNISMTDVQAFIDSAPYTDVEALEAGYVDSLLTEEQIAGHLDVKPNEIVSWDKAQNQVFFPIRPHSRKFIGLLSIRGMIVPGESANPPGDVPIPLLGGPRAGDLTVVQQVRQLMENEHLGAAIVYVDSPGGSATASEAMTSALDELAKKVPVVIYMNGCSGFGRLLCIDTCSLDRRATWNHHWINWGHQCKSDYSGSF